MQQDHSGEHFTNCKRKTKKKKKWMTEEIINAMKKRQQTMSKNAITYRMLIKNIRKKCNNNPTRKVYKT